MTLMSIDIPQCKQFYVFIVTLLLISVHYIFSSRFFSFYSKGGGGSEAGEGKGGNVEGSN